MSLEKKFKELESGEKQVKEVVEKGFGKRGYYKKEESEREKRRGYAASEVSEKVKESPLVVLLLLIAVAAAGYFVFFYTPETVSASFNLVVYSGEARLPQATVNVYDGETLVGSASTDSNGRASFSSLPGKPLRFEVTSPNGATTTERVINPAGRAIFNLNLQGSEISGDSITLTVLDQLTRQGIQGIKLAYSLGSSSEKLFVETDANGKAVMQLNGQSIVRLRAVDPQRRYQAESLTFIASREITAILLSAVEQSGLGLQGESPFDQTVSLTVFIRGENGEVIENGEVSAFYVFTGAEITSAQFQGGEAGISGITRDSLVSIAVHAAGYYPGQVSSVLASGDAQPVIVNLEKIPQEAVKTRIIASEDVTGEVYIFQKGNLTQLISSILNNGVVEFNLPDGEYYALVNSPGYLPATSFEFINGDEVNVDLLPLTDGVNLEVNVVDEENAAVVGASIAVVNENGLLMALPVYSQFGASSTFTLPVDSRGIVRTALEPSESSQEFELNQDTAVTLTLLAHAGLLDLRVKNLADNSFVDEVMLTSYYEGKRYNSCSGNGGCVVAVRGGNDVAVEISAVGFLPYTYYDEAIPEFASKAGEVRIIPSALASGLNVDLLEIIDRNGNSISGTVLRPGVYNAKFFVSSKNAEALSLYVRAEDGTENASLSSVHLLEPLSVNEVEVAKSSTYLGSGVQCSDLVNPVFEPPYKWVELTFSKTSSQEVDVPFEIPLNIAEDTAFSLAFRAKAVTGEVHARQPADPVLGLLPASQEKANCYAETTQREFIVSASRAPVIEDVFPVIEGEFTAGDALVFNPVQRSIASQNGLTEYELQVDSILPGDAMPLKLQSDQQCTIIAKQPNSTSNLLSSSCYRYDSGKQMLVFESKELNPLCPIYLKEDKFYNEKNARVNEDSATLKILASCASAEMEIPIKVKFASGVSSLTVKPEEGQLGEGDAAKLLYVINNRQLQSRNLEVLYGNRSSALQLRGPSSRAIAWRGPGTLEFSENGDLVQEVIFENKAMVFKPGVGVLSHRQTSCGASKDVYCCSNGWCTRKALEQFVPEFKETGQQLAKNTAFRRGEGQPFNYFSTTPFKFVTIVQVAQGGQSALEVEGVSFNSPLACISGNPGVYELTAFTSSGEEDEWNYTAKTLELKNSDYIQSPNNCGASSNVTVTSLTANNGETKLCNFLWPRENCIVSSKNSTITSIDQVETLKFELTNCVYPVFPGAPVCPGTKMVLPAVNLGNLKMESDFDPANAPNAFKRIWTAVSDSDSSKFSVFSWQGQLKCIVPPSFQQFGISAASLGLANVNDFAKEEAVEKKPRQGVVSDVCSRQDFFNLGVMPNAESIIPLAGVCCPTTVNAEFCTERRGKFFISSKGDTVKVVTKWGLTENCYPYWPFPTTLHGLLQAENIVSVAFGLTQFLTSNGADFEMSLSSELPGETYVASTGLSSVPCRGDSECSEFDQCAVNSIYHNKGSGANGQGKCIGASQSSPGVCAYSQVSKVRTCDGGTQCKQVEKTASCLSCGGPGEACCIQSNGKNAFCKAGACCIVRNGNHECVSECGRIGQPVCGGWQSDPKCNEGKVKPPSATDLEYSTCG